MRRPSCTRRLRLEIHLSSVCCWKMAPAPTLPNTQDTCDPPRRTPRTPAALLDAGYDPNYMLHPWVRRSYDDERKSVLFFAVSNNDVDGKGKLLSPRDDIKPSVALHLGNYELINLLLWFGTNVNYYCRVNTTHFPSTLQYALKDEVVLRMLCNYGYDVGHCFDCPYGNSPHIPEDYEGWSNTVIKDTLVTNRAESTPIYQGGHTVELLGAKAHYLNWTAEPR